MSNSPNSSGTVEISKAVIGCLGLVLAATISGIFLLISSGAVQISFSPTRVEPTATLVRPTAIPSPTVKQVLLADSPTPQPQITPLSTSVQATSAIPIAIPTQPHTPTPTPESVTIFFDDFEDGIDPAWQSVPVWLSKSGEWIMSNGHVLAQSCGAHVIGDSNWDNIALDVDYYYPMGDFYIILAYKDEQNYAVVRFLISDQSGTYYDAITTEIDAVRDGKEGKVAGSQIYDNQYREHQQINRIHAEVRGKELRILLNEKQIYRYVLTQSLAGKVGVYTCPGNSGEWLDNVRVSYLQP